MKDFFISYTKADQSWAEWIAWQLVQEGYTTVIQAWDFRPGSNFVINMQKAAEDSNRTIMVLSPNYLNSLYTQPEWTAAFAQDPTGVKKLLIPVRVKKCDLKGMLSQIVYIDLVGLDKSKAKMALLEGIDPNPVKPVFEPNFPGHDKSPEYEGPRFPGELPPIWNLPFRRNPNFTGRDEYLSKLESELKSGSHAALTQAIRGMGGIGKTQIALEYAYRYSTNYQAIWWIRAEDERTLTADYAAFAIETNLPEKDAPEEQIVINAVQNWLEHNQNWLFIFDNAVKPEDVKPFLPLGASGHVLITSRHQDWENLCSSLSIDIWPREESVDFLNRRTKQKSRSSTNILAKELGDLPLALEQAAAFIKGAGIGFDDYLKLYRNRRTELWDEENPPLDYPDTVGTTWSLAVEKVQEEAPAGKIVLNLCSYFAPDRIPRSFISKASEYLSEKYFIHINDSLALNKGIKTLNQYSLITAEPDSLTAHRLVQAVVRDKLKQAEREIWSKTAIQVVYELFPSDGDKLPGLWPKCSALVPHGKTVIEHAVENNVGLDYVVNLLNKIALYLQKRAAFSDAEALFRYSLNIIETTFGDEQSGKTAVLDNHTSVHQNTITISSPETCITEVFNNLTNTFTINRSIERITAALNNLASVLHDQGKYKEAEPLYRRAMNITKSHFGDNHLNYARSLNNLALLFSEQGNYAEAEPLLRKALGIVENYSGGENPDVANCLNNLGQSLHQQGKLAEADPLYRRALDIVKMHFGTNHPYFATSLDNLAILSKDQSKYTNAKELHNQALEIRERLLGADHPDVAQSLNNLALLLNDMGNYSEAEPLYHRAMEIYASHFGTDHPGTATIRNNLEKLLSNLASRDNQ